ncbi:MAG: GNAT family N-acetyltransferase [Leptospiraceae bacterium]|nr:GNAT family N-acetyltransferase [Leptospiraceae bacterium]
MNPSFIIRNLSPAETAAPAVRRLLIESDPDYRSINQYGRNACAIAALYETQVAALCAFGKSEQSGLLEIFNLVVQQQFRRRGLAGQLLNYVIKHTKSRPVRVGTGSTSFAALALYQKTGFRIVAVERDYFVRTSRPPMIENGIQLHDRLLLELW